MMRHLAGGSEDGPTCPRIYDGEDGTILVQGALVVEREVTGVTLPEAHEAVVRVPRALFEAAAARLVGP
jgi:hypothetical protein